MEVCGLHQYEGDWRFQRGVIIHLDII